MLINVHQAKTQLSRLLARVEAGEEVIIGRAGVPIARLVPYRGRDRLPREPGAWRGRVEVGRDFDDRLPAEVAAAFRGERD